jgi:glycosyltransferase involved in cell wall biosynthesis
MKLLELVMIVKNSGEVLRDCLRINKKYIDQWTILDTGSTDNTIEIIKDELKDIPGNLYQEPFIDFATSRN